MNTGFRSMTFRPEASRHVILITDEDRDVYENYHTYHTMQDSFQELDINLHTIVNADISIAGQPADALGITGETTDDTAYYADGAGGYTTSDSGGVSYSPGSDAGGVGTYISLAFDSGGTNWDLGKLPSSGPNQVSFTRAFVDSTSDVVETGPETTLLATDPDVNFEIISESRTNNTVTYEVQFTGDGLAHNFDLQIVREDDASVMVGSIPVTIRTDYFYDLDAIDADGDPLSYSLIGETHGAVVDEVTGLLDWTPPGAGDYEFTAMVTDGRGGHDVQTWTVNVTIAGAGNTPPVVQQSLH